MKRKGFTLVELLAVIVILSLLMAIAVPTSITVSKKIKEKMLDSKLNFAVQSSILWGQDNANCFTTTTCSALSSISNACTTSSDGKTRSCKITLAILAANGYISYDDETKQTIISPVDKSDISGKTILITYTYSSKSYTAAIQ